MTITFDVLGKPGRDNAVFARIDSGQNVAYLLFDCGEGCLSELSVAEIQAVDHVLFSHFHMDHISGFDSFFRLTYDRTVKDNCIWGPPGSNSVMKHRFGGFLWNIYQHLESNWYVHDIHPDRIESVRFDGNEAFAEAHPLPSKSFATAIIDTPQYSVEAYHMNHQTPSIAYVIREKPRINIDPNRLKALGLSGGSWLQQIKTEREGEPTTIEIKGTTYTVAELRAQLLTRTPGQSLAYLTDFIMEASAHSLLVKALQGCTTMICESQYRAQDDELAQKNFHMTSVQAARVAKEAQVEKLILFHVSDRYQSEEWTELLREAQEIFPNTQFAEGWQS